MKGVLSRIVSHADVNDSVFFDFSEHLIEVEPDQKVLA